MNHRLKCVSILLIIISSLISCKDDKLETFGINSLASNELGGLRIGDLAPEFILEDENGNPQKLSTHLSGAPVILTFYRGHWCGYCTKYLADLQDAIKELQKRALVLHFAISPEKAKYTKEMMYDKMLSLDFLHDKDHKVMKDYKVYYKLNKDYQEKLAKHTDTSIEELHDNPEPVLPIPASYVIGQDHRIKYVYYNPDYSQRADIDSLLAYFD